MIKNKTVLVTGGAGFIGANLIRELVKNQHYSIHVITPVGSDLWRLDSIVDQLTIHEIDMASRDTIDHLIKIIKPNYIYHLAAFGGMPNETNPQMVYDVNFYGTMNLLNACKEVGFDCFINTGSSSEYGIKAMPMDETMALEPVSDYGVAKAAATHYCLKEALFHKLPVYTVRPFSVYGDYEAPTRLIPSIIVNALHGLPITLSCPNHVRDFIYIKDMVKTYMLITQIKPQNSCIFNAGTGIQSTIQDVVTIVEKLLNKKLNVSWGTSSPRPWEPKAWQANIQNSQQTLGLSHHYTLDKGLEASISWFDNHLSLYSERKAPYAQSTTGTTSTTPLPR